MLRGISAGLIGRGWALIDRQPGLVTAQVLVRGKHILVVTIKYEHASYDIDYKSSDNLNYWVKDDGTVMLHPNGNHWMENIRRDILKELQLQCSHESSAK